MLHPVGWQVRLSEEPGVEPLTYRDAGCRDALSVVFSLGFALVNVQIPLRLNILPMRNLSRCVRAFCASLPCLPSY